MVAFFIFYIRYLNAAYQLSIAVAVTYLYHCL